LESKTKESPVLIGGNSIWSGVLNRIFISVGVYFMCITLSQEKEIRKRKRLEFVGIKKATANCKIYSNDTTIKLSMFWKVETGEK